MRLLIAAAVLSCGGCLPSSDYQTPPYTPPSVPDMAVVPDAAPSSPRWTLVNSNTQAPLYGIWASTDSEIFVAGGGGLILRSTDRGITWSRLSSGTSETLFGIWGQGADGPIYAFGYRGMLLYSTDHGEHFTAVTGINSQASLFGMGGTAGDFYIAGESGTVLHSSDGTTWAALTAPSAQPLYAVWATPGEVFITGDDGVYRTRDAGLSWTNIGVPAGTGLRRGGRSLWSPGSADLFVCGSNIQHTRDGGITWEFLTSTTSFASCRGLIGFPSGDLWAVYSDGMQLHYDTGYTRLQNAYQNKAPQPLYAIWGTAANNLYVVGDVGLIQQYQ